APRREGPTATAARRECPAAAGEATAATSAREAAAGEAAAAAAGEATAAAAAREATAAAREAARATTTPHDAAGPRRLGAVGQLVGQLALQLEDGRIHRLGFAVQLDLIVHRVHPRVGQPVQLEVLPLAVGVDEAEGAGETIEQRLVVQGQVARQT